MHLSQQSHQSPWKASTHLLHLPSHQTIPSLNLTFHAELHLPSSQTTCSSVGPEQPFMDSLPSAPPPNKIFLKDQGIVDLNWWGDASTSFGVGIGIGKFFAVWKYAPGLQVGPKKAFDIGWAEAVVVELGLHLATQLKLLQGTNILVHSDNSGIITVVNKGRSRSLETNKILKHVYLLQAKAGIRLHATYVSSCNNISDALSQGRISEFLQGFPSAHIQVTVPLPEHLIDKLIPWSQQQSSF
jgi:hypothetical protein